MCIYIYICVCVYAHVCVFVHLCCYMHTVFFLFVSVFLYLASNFMLFITTLSYVVDHGRAYVGSFMPMFLGGQNDHPVKCCISQCADGYNVWLSLPLQSCISGIIVGFSISRWVIYPLTNQSIRVYLATPPCLNYPDAWEPNMQPTRCNKYQQMKSLSERYIPVN